MSAVMQWAFSLCGAMVAMGLSRMLLPSSGMEKTFRMVVSVFFLCCLLSPVIVRMPELLMEAEPRTQAEIEERSRRVSQMADEYAMATAKSRLKQMIGVKLSQMGIKEHTVTINFTTGEGEQTELESVSVTLDITHKEEEKALIKELEAELGCSVWLYYTGEEGE